MPLAVTGSAVLLCAHGGSARSLLTSPRVRMSGSPVLTAVPLAVTGCTNLVPPAGVGPCVLAQFTSTSTRVRVGGLPVVVQSGASLCSPTGTPLTVVLAGQTRVQVV